MAKRFDCEDEPNEYMEAPCRCDCGNWFDLEDGHRVSGGKVVCRECKESHDFQEREEEIENLKEELTEAEYTVIQCRKRLAELGVEGYVIKVNT